MRLIDADALLDYLQMIPIDLGYREVDDIEKYVKEAPTAYVTACKRGEWKDIHAKLGTCSVCGCRTNLWNFCPNCGADMRGDNNDA